MPSTTTILLRLLGLAFLVAVLSTRADAIGVTASPRNANAAWMPDVAERVAELRERALVAVAEARARRNETGSAAQWWRAVAPRPLSAVSR